MCIDRFDVAEFVVYGGSWERAQRVNVARRDMRLLGFRWDCREVSLLNGLCAGVSRPVYIELHVCFFFRLQPLPNDVDSKNVWISRQTRTKSFGND